MKQEIDARLPNAMAWKASEHSLQVEVMAQLAILSHEYPELDEVFAIPNGDLRNIRVATKLKAEGVRSGVADLCLPVPVGGYHGAWIELKKAKGQIKKEQWEWLLARHRSGYFVRVVNCAAVASRLLYDYCAGKYTRP
ncbi:MAG: VRR-NUC domain-containing protein [Luteolibacter sp.]